MFDLSRIARHFPGHLDHHESLGSTSDRALELAATGDVPLPLLVLAERQTGGRGRGLNRWWAAEGALTFTLVVDSSAAALSLALWPRAALVAGLAICEALAELAPAAEWRVKWPNDVFASGGKICGILCESVPGWKDRLAIGIGINVNNSLAAAPDDIRHAARSLVDLDGAPRDLTGVLLAVLDRLEARWADLAAGRFGELAAAYRRLCLLTGRMLTVESAGETLVGRCLGIDDAGALVIATESGPRGLVAGTIRSWE
ncbi:MAG: biotin--[acetyl-CoA-carboxylase] ligase [Pirellulaceae bacterium]|nr:biotin--[acetyl-CoA-carboxylase] ligase [Pirellulaceae bacterium]